MMIMGGLGARSESSVRKSTEGADLAKFMTQNQQSMGSGLSHQRLSGRSHKEKRTESTI